MSSYLSDEQSSSDATLPAQSLSRIAIEIAICIRNIPPTSLRHSSVFQRSIRKHPSSHHIAYVVNMLMFEIGDSLLPSLHTEVSMTREIKYFVDDKEKAGDAYVNLF